MKKFSLLLLAIVFLSQAEVKEVANVKISIISVSRAREDNNPFQNRFILQCKNEQGTVLQFSGADGLKNYLSLDLSYTNAKELLATALSAANNKQPVVIGFNSSRFFGGTSNGAYELAYIVVIY